MNFKKQYEGIMIIGISAIVLFTLIDYVLPNSHMIIPSAMTGFSVGVSFIKRFGDNK